MTGYIPHDSSKVWSTKNELDFIAYLKAKGNAKALESLRKYVDVRNYDGPEMACDVAAIRAALGMRERGAA